MVVKRTVLCAQDMADISLDVPAAYLVLERWVIRCRQVRSVFLPPGSEFFHPGSRVKKIPDPDRHQRI
jgi:hypothetical protein